MDVDACDFWIGLDLDWFFAWIKIGFGLSFGFGLTLD
jgi:hypothetical protein